MKAYISCPVTQSRKRIDLMPVIDSVVKAKGIDSFVFTIGGTPEEIFERDYSEIKKCNIMICDVSEPSLGVGIEVGISQSLGHKIILTHEKGTTITPLALGIPGIVIVEYSDEEDLKNKLNSVLS